MSDAPLNPLVSQITARLPWLFSDDGFHIAHYSADRLGNCSADVESERLQITFTQDRGFTSAKLAPVTHAEKSFELGFLLLSIQGKRPDFGFEGAAVLLKDNWAVIVEALGPKYAETRLEYERREQESREALERYQSQLKVTPHGRINLIKRTSGGRMLFRVLRLLELGLVLWAIYTVFR